MPTGKSHSTKSPGAVHEMAALPSSALTGSTSGTEGPYGSGVTTTGSDEVEPQAFLATSAHDWVRP